MKKAYRTNLHSISSAIITLCFTFAAINLRAQTSVDLTTSTFVRVSELSQITDSDIYLIGATGLDNRFYFLSSQKYAQASGSKLLAVQHKDTAPDIIMGANATTGWKLQLNTAKTTVALFAADESGSVTQSGTNDLLVNSATPQTWNLVQNDNGTFSFLHPSKTNYAIGLMTYDQYAIFGNYSTYTADTVELVLYKRAKSLEEVHGNLTFPSDQQDIGIVSTDKIALTDRSGTSLENYLLANGDIARDNELMALKFQQKDATTCYLQTETGTYLQHNLQYGATPAEWVVSNGQLATNTTPLRFVVYLSSEQRFSVETATDAITKGGFGIAFQKLGDKPSASITTAGTKKLSGAWSANAIAQTDFTDITALDLTAISLPVAAKAFATDLSVLNRPIYVNLDEISHVPTDWRWVVACDDEGNNALVRSTNIVDKTPLTFDRKIEWSSGVSLYYERQTYLDGGWETICLPFAWRPAGNFQASKFVQSANGQLTFATANLIEAYTPAIIRYRGTPQDVRANMSFIAVGNTIEPADNTDANTFCGNFADLNITATNHGNIYFLEETGKNFKKAAVGSHLSPFRAYLNFTSTSNAIKVNFQKEDTTTH